MNKLADQHVRMIEKTYFGITCDGGTTLADCIISEGYGDDESRKDAIGKNITTDWHFIKSEWIEEYNFVFCFADGVGARFMLPPYLIWVIQNVDHAPSFTVDSVIGGLRESGKERRYRKSDTFTVHQLLSSQQRVAICKFLRYMINQKSQYCHVQTAKAALLDWSAANESSPVSGP